MEKTIHACALTIGVWIRPEFVSVEAHVLFAVRHAVLHLTSECNLIVAREQERLAEILLEVHAIKGTEFRAQPLEQVGTKAVALGAHQLIRRRRKESRDTGSEKRIVGEEEAEASKV